MLHDIGLVPKWSHGGYCHTLPLTILYHLTWMEEYCYDDFMVILACFLYLNYIGINLEGNTCIPVYDMVLAGRLGIWVNDNV